MLFLFDLPRKYFYSSDLQSYFFKFLIKIFTSLYYNIPDFLNFKIVTLKDLRPSTIWVVFIIIVMSSPRFSPDPDDPFYYPCARYVDDAP